MGGLISYLAGVSAEEAVSRHYGRLGRTIAATRWRGEGGEIDVIARDGTEVIFIEVKKAATHAQAALRLSERQMARIASAASEFLGGEPLGQDTPARFDVALVDDRGMIDIIENAFAA